MGRSIYLINPRADFPTYYGAEVYAGRGFAPAAFLADLVVPTLAAMVPPDFEVSLMEALIRYQQLRYMFETSDFWNRDERPVSARPDPVESSAGS